MKTNIFVFYVSLKIASSKATGGIKEWQREILNLINLALFFKF